VLSFTLGSIRVIIRKRLSPDMTPQPWTSQPIVNFKKEIFFFINYPGCCIELWQKTNGLSDNRELKNICEIVKRRL
jgi:hypothetical protein